MDGSIRKNLKETYENHFKIHRVTLSMHDIANFGKDLIDHAEKGRKANVR